MSIALDWPEILRISYKPNFVDPDPRLSLWANFDIDRDRFVLNIESSLCGNAGCGFYSKSERIGQDSHGSGVGECVTDDGTFMQLLARMDTNYLMSKLFKEDCVDVPRTIKRVRYAIDNRGEQDENMDLDPEKVEKDIKELESTLDMWHDDIAEARHALGKWAQEHEEYKLGDTWEIAAPDYSSGQKKIGEIFEIFIRPKIREMIKEGRA